MSSSNKKLLATAIYVGALLFSITNLGCAKTVQAFKIPTEGVETEFVRIFILRPSFVGTAVSSNIYENSKLIGRLGPKAYLVWDTKAGDVTIQGGKDFIRILAKPGNTYYLKMVPKFSYKPETFTFIPITSEEAQAELSKMKPPRTKIIGG